MGMFDSFYFDKDVLRNNKEEPSTEFQSKDLDCELDKYRMGKDSMEIEKFYPDEFKPDSFKARVYSIEKGREQEYIIHVHRGKIIFQEKVIERGYKEINNE